MNKSAMRKEVHIEVSEGISKKSDGSLWQPLIDDESNIIDWLHLCSAHGLNITQEYFFEEILNYMQVLTHGKISGDDVREWLRGFRRRWSERLQSGPSGTSLLADGSAAPPAPSAALWYRAVSGSVATRYPAVRFGEPSRLLHLAIVNIQLDSRTGAVRRVRTDAEAATAQRDNVAFLVAASADGEQAPLMMVTPSGGLVRADLDPEDDCIQHTTSNGAVTSEALRRYVAERLDPHLSTLAVPRPVLLYVDGRHHHVSRDVGRLCDDVGLELIGLPPNASSRGPMRSAITALLAANLARMAETAQRGRRTEPDGGSSASARALLAGFRTATRRATAASIAHAFQWSGLSPWSESIVSACETGAAAPELADVQLPPPPPAPLSAPTGLPVPPALPRDVEWVVRLLLSDQLQREHPSPLEPAELPRPGPGSAAFLVNTPPGGDASCSDDQPPPLYTADGWVLGSTVIQSYLINDNVFERVYMNKAGRFCLRESVKRELEPLLTSSDRIVEVRREHSTWWSDTSRLRRVTKVSCCQSQGTSATAVAFYEFYPEYQRGTQGTRTGGTPKEGVPPRENGDEMNVGEEELAAPTLAAVDAVVGNSMRIPPTGLSDDRVVRLLLDPTQLGPALADPPTVKAPNTAYLVNNETNRDRRLRGLNPRYVDGPEKWKGGSQLRGRLHTILFDEDNGARRVFRSGGRYFHSVKRDGRFVGEPLDPLPTGDETEIQLRLAECRQLDGPLHRRISWIEACDPMPGHLPPVALYEYTDGGGDADSGEGDRETGQDDSSARVQVQPTEGDGKQGNDSDSGDEDSGSESESGSDEGGKRTSDQNGYEWDGNSKRRRTETED